MIDLYQLAGFVGVAFYLGAYGLLQLGVIRGNDYPYALMNLAAASLVLVSLLTSWNLFSAIIQISWITLSVLGMGRVWLMTRGLRFSGEEQTLLDAHFPTLRRYDARKVLGAGTWTNRAPGDTLTEQGVPVMQLCYIHRGGADIEIGGQVIAQVGAGGFIGEMGCMTSAPASATVRVNAPTRIFVLSSVALRRLVKRNPDLSPHLEFAFSGNTRAKLMATNALLQQSLSARQSVSETA
ncbi:cyclic nucleotide-binding domain-containing protein [uncultured Tateyamaria sp.]|uniref:cyclic nucleotide-binding domain-containing protein n=1 Tax=Tateyamaria sp. 1078 TaxID=3417464 RepID=UPI002627A15C|nr:cyclic nucleotide-binding domain-containing protein [uncultured Tateyamaria sp.]